MSIGFILFEIKCMSDIISKFIGMNIVFNKVIVGKNVFVYELGIY